MVRMAGPRRQRKERLPFEAVYHDDTYKPLEEVKTQIEDYDQRVSEYYKARTDGKRDVTAWSDQVISMLNKNSVWMMKSSNNRGFLGQ